MRGRQKKETSIKIEEDFSNTNTNNNTSNNNNNFPLFLPTPITGTTLWDECLLGAISYRENISFLAKHQSKTRRKISQQLVKAFEDKRKEQEILDEARGVALTKIGKQMARAVDKCWTRAKRGFEAKCALEVEIEKQQKAEKRQATFLKDTEKLTAFLAESFRSLASTTSTSSTTTSAAATASSSSNNNAPPLVEFEHNLSLLNTLDGRRPLRPYQRSALTFLINLYSNNLNAILADEMGLGKTLQTLALFAYYAEYKQDWGPHLVVVPSSILANWELECMRWVPGLKVLKYHGSIKERQKLRQGWTKENCFHICLVSYQTVVQDRNVFKRRPWGFLVLDEAHNIKNWQSQKWQVLFEMQSKYRLLLTGTPLQTSVMELWALLRFIVPPHVAIQAAQTYLKAQKQNNNNNSNQNNNQNQQNNSNQVDDVVVEKHQQKQEQAGLAAAFENMEDFQRWFSDPLTAMVSGQSEFDTNVVVRLHTLLRPFFFRRLKCDVESQLPPKKEVVVLCPLSRRQRTLYEDFLALAETRETLAAGSYLGVVRVLLSLRKVCDHPDLFAERPVLAPFVLDPQVDRIKVRVPRCIFLWGFLEKNSYFCENPFSDYSHSHQRHNKKKKEEETDESSSSYKYFRNGRGRFYFVSSSSSSDSNNNNNNSTSNNRTIMRKKGNSQDIWLANETNDLFHLTTIASSFSDCSAGTNTNWILHVEDLNISNNNNNKDKKQDEEEVLMKEVDQKPKETRGRPRKHVVVASSKTSSSSSSSSATSSKVKKEVKQEEETGEEKEERNQLLLEQQIKNFIRQQEQKKQDQVSEFLNLLNYENASILQHQQEFFSGQKENLKNNNNNIDDDRLFNKPVEDAATSLTRYSYASSSSSSSNSNNNNNNNNSNENIIATKKAQRVINFNNKRTESLQNCFGFVIPTWLFFSSSSSSSSSKSKLKNNRNRNKISYYHQKLFFDEEQQEEPSLASKYFIPTPTERIQSCSSTLKHFIVCVPKVFAKSPMLTCAYRVSSVSPSSSTSSTTTATGIMMKKSSVNLVCHFDSRLSSNSTNSSSSNSFATCLDFADPHDVANCFCSLIRHECYYQQQQQNNNRNKNSGKILRKKDLIREFQEEEEEQQQQQQEEKQQKQLTFSPVSYHELNQTRQPRIPASSSNFESSWILSHHFHFPDSSWVVQDCGKFFVLYPLFKKLVAEGHRVLIFTQFTAMLSILEKFLAFMGLLYLRLDASLSPDERQFRVENFNRDARIFAMVLSTRSGGIGLNLIGADTVVFFDSDWNPSADAQAQDRCHRIGQTRAVTIYRLVSEHTVERSIIQKARQRKMLNNIVIRSGRFDRQIGGEYDPEKEQQQQESAAAASAIASMNRMNREALLNFFHDRDEDAEIMNLGTAASGEKNNQNQNQNDDDEKQIALTTNKPNDENVENENDKELDESWLKLTAAVEDADDRDAGNAQDDEQKRSDKNDWLVDDDMSVEFAAAAAASSDNNNDNNESSSSWYQKKNNNQNQAAIIPNPMNSCRIRRNFVGLSSTSSTTTKTQSNIVSCWPPPFNTDVGMNQRLTVAVRNATNATPIETFASASVPFFQRGSCKAIRAKVTGEG